MTKYRASCSICFDFDTDLPYHEAVELAKKHLNDIPASDGIQDIRILLQLDKLKNKVEKIRLAEFTLDEVIPYFSTEHTKREYIVNGISHLVKMNSDRYFVFRRQMSCVSCGLEGTRIFLECLPGEVPHFNLYGDDNGKLVMFTKDHIKAKCFGGQDELDNYQTMCSVCNSLKAHSNLSLDAVRNLRQTYIENKDKIPKKKLHLLMEQERVRLQQPWEFSQILEETPPSVDAMKVKRSFKVCEVDGELFSAVDPEPGANVIGTIEMGMYLEPLIEINRHVCCRIWKDKTIKVERSLLQ